MTQETIITATDASRGFSDLLHRVCYGGETFIIKKGARVMARIAPVEQVAAPALPPPPEDAQPDNSASHAMIAYMRQASQP